MELTQEQRIELREILKITKSPILTTDILKDFIEKYKISLLSITRRDKIKEFKPSSWAIDNKMTIYLVTIFISLAGIMAYNSLPKENFPDITVPTIYINTINGGNSPTNIENTITKPIEKRLKGISGVKKFNSTSLQDVSVIVVEFHTNVKVEVAKQKVKDIEKKEYTNKQFEMFLNIWSKRRHYCESCGLWLGNEPLSIFFDHLLEKSIYKEFALLEENIYLCCGECHTKKTNGFPTENHRKTIKNIKDLLLK